MIGRKRLALRIVSVLSVAVAAGHLVQTIRSAPEPLQAIVRALDEIPKGSLPQISGITAVAATAGDDPACALKLALATAPEAMIDLSLHAPCNVGDRVVIRHSGLAFTGSIGVDGRLGVQFPALSTEALVAAYVGGSEIVLGIIAVEEVRNYLRLAVHMPSSASFDLRAEESGQVYVASKAVPGKGPHRIILLGQRKVEDPLVAQVYSVALKDFADPVLTLELRMTSETCGRTLSAEITVSRAGRAIEARRDIAVPLCGTTGDILLLKNLFPDLTLATPE